jgi:hypothetical protein
MPRKRKPKPTTTPGKLDSHYIYRPPEGSHPSQVSGLFKDDPAFEEFREILRQQREEDYRRVNEEIDAMIRQEEEAKGCLSLIPMPSHTTKTDTPSSA